MSVAPGWAVWWIDVFLSRNAADFGSISGTSLCDKSDSSERKRDGLQTEPFGPQVMIELNLLHLARSKMWRGYVGSLANPLLAISHVKNDLRKKKSPETPHENGAELDSKAVRHPELLWLRADHDLPLFDLPCPTMKLRHPAGDIRTQWSSRKRCASSGLSVAPGSPSSS